MARIRSVKPDFFTSERVAELPLSARLTFIGLWTHVDDNGVTVDNGRLIAAAIWPLEEDPRETLRRTLEDLRRLSDAGLVVRYEADGRRLLYVRGWDEHQKVSHPGKPRYPRPDTMPPKPPTSGDGLDHSDRDEYSGESPESLASPPEILRPEQGAGSREERAGSRETPSRALARTPARDVAPPDDGDPPTRVEALVTEYRENSQRGVSSKNARKLSEEIHQLILDGFTDLEIRNGLWQMRQRGFGPALLAQVVEEMANKASPLPDNVRALPAVRPSTTDQRVSAALALAAKYDALEGGTA
jgi:hypothetical protein